MPNNCLFITGTIDSLQSIQSSSVPLHQNCSDLGLNTSDFGFLLCQLMLSIIMYYFIPQSTINLESYSKVKVICKTTSEFTWSVVWELQLYMITEFKMLLQLYSVENYGDETFAVTWILPEKHRNHFLKTCMHGCNNDDSHDGNDDNDDDDHGGSSNRNDDNEVICTI